MRSRSWSVPVARGGHAVADEIVGSGRAGAKLILFGEHVVLYGAPAISLPVPSLPVTARARRWDGPVVIESAPFDAVPSGRPGESPVARMAVTAACDRLGIPDDGLFVTVDSGIPPGRGFGSSAASSAAIIIAVADLWNEVFDDDTLFTLVQRAEALAHGKASGVDARTVISPGGPLWFRHGVATPLALPTRPEPPVLVVADTGVYGSTHLAVETVRRRLVALGGAGTQLLTWAEALTTDAAVALAEGRFAEVGAAMTTTHGILGQLGVSCPEIETLVAAALAADALGAKLSGGGLGGCVIALATDTAHAQRVRAAVLAAGARNCHTVTLRVGEGTA
ncbi:mevalonate kinase [Nocardia sp. AG03]|uniref:mevalonate kinase n=1 Tax=Nocardia sp. AG03 TaxID=3025312 RepID=UPI00241826C3|nr:mevalonate kinase [Nocardia sp. AG03]